MAISGTLFLLFFPEMAISCVGFFHFARRNRQIAIIAYGFCYFSENGNFGYAFLPFWLSESPNELFGWCVLSFFRDEHGRKELCYLLRCFVPNRFGIDVPWRAV